MKCALGKAIPDKMDAEQIKRDAWRKDNILVVSLEDDRLDVVDRELIARIGNHLYGRGDEIRRSRKR